MKKFQYCASLLLQPQIAEASTRYMHDIDESCNKEGVGLPKIFEIETFTEP